jgi:DNA-binding NtrC family response regulator
LVGPSEVAAATRRAVADATAGRGPVLLTAEPGCRPGDIARAVHDSSSAGSPWIVIDCSASVAADLDERLFGAAARRAPQELEIVGHDSAIVAAGRGTLYLEHIEELPASAQRRLARILRDGEVTIAGNYLASPSLFRLVGTTTKDLEAEARDGRFRSELFRRLAARIVVPSLRQRPQDIPAVLERLACDMGHRGVTMTTAALTILSAMPWPGNLDELALVFARILETTHGMVRQEDVLLHLPIQGGFTRPDLTASLRDARRQFERDYIAAVLERHHWRMSAAARTLGIERANLYRKTRQLGISRGTRVETVGP